MIKLAIDAMGGDFAPEEIVKGVNLAIEEYDDIELVLYGDKEQINKFLKPNKRVTVIHAPDTINMGEKDPIREIRKNKDTSLVKAFQAVKDKEVQGVITAGPTQATIIAAHLIIRRLKGMKRVALCPTLPHLGGKNRLLLDVGANIELRADHILQLSQFATIYMQEVMNVKNPLVALLNIGSEPGKGREVDKEAYNLLLNDPHINFYGNLEPKELLSTECDILITDGYTGNMIMKTSEGVAKAVGTYLKESINKSLKAKIGYLFMKDVFKDFKKVMSADEIGGASIFGIDGIVIKAHGASSAYAFKNAVDKARLAVKGEVIKKMQIVLSEMVEEDE
ncbi:MAG TPA: phosphate acyltransferase PlsX [Acholeplasmataceae bacterium]|nr:phosphate acyltransferase PlsX [Acholeplasmataceae bacterium]